MNMSQMSIFIQRTKQFTRSCTCLIIIYDCVYCLDENLSFQVPVCTNDLPVPGSCAQRGKLIESYCIMIYQNIYVFLHKRCLFK